MIWREVIDITDSKNINKAMKDYIKLVIVALEDQELVFLNSLSKDRQYIYIK